MTYWEAEELLWNTSGAFMRPVQTEWTGLPRGSGVCFFPSHMRLFKFRSHQATCLPSNGMAWLTCAGHRRRVRECSVVAVLAVAAPGALAVVEAVRRTARALKVLGGRLVETTTARCGREKKRMKPRQREEKTQLEAVCTDSIMWGSYVIYQLPPNLSIMKFAKMKNRWSGVLNLTISHIQFPKKNKRQFTIAATT